MIGPAAATRRNAKGRYLAAALLLAVAVLFFGWVLDRWISAPAALGVPAAALESGADQSLSRVFGEAVAQMRQGNYRQALDGWHRALLLAPEIPEIKVNMGFTLYELGEYATARDAFISAMEQNAYQSNAYYGLAIASEKMGDLEGALGAMRSYIHLAAGGEDDRYIRRARSALWEWEALLAERAAGTRAGEGDG